MNKKREQMKIVVVGGSGRVGRRIVSELAQHSNVEITVADQIAPERAEQQFVRVDLSKPKELAEAINDFDLVINSVGPFDRWGTVVLDAAIATQKDYLDVCDDPLPTLELIARHEAAEQAGIRAIVGLGVSPGLTNFLAVIAAQQLENTNTLVTFWGDSAEGKSIEWAKQQAAGLAKSFDQGRAAYTHLIIQASSEVPVWKEGEKATERAWKRGFRVTTSKGETGSYRVIGHPEPVTVPHQVATTNCYNIGTVGAGTDQLMLPVLEQVIAGNLDTDGALQEIAQTLRENPEVLATPKLGSPLPRNIGAAAVGKSVMGEDGFVVFPAGPVDGSMSLETARPAVVGALNIKNVPLGVHAPEAAFDAKDFMQKYSDIYWGGIDPFIIDHAGINALKEEE